MNRRDESRRCIAEHARLSVISANVPQKLPKHASSLLPRDLVREIASLGEDYDLGAAEAFAGRAAAKLDVNGASAEVRRLHPHLRLLLHLYPCF